MGSDSGKLITWGSADDEGQSYMTSGKHGVIHIYSSSQDFNVCLDLVLIWNFLIAIVEDTPEPFPLPTQALVLMAAAGWAHCVTVTGTTLPAAPLSHAH